MHSKWFFLLLLCVEFLAHPALAREDASLPKVSSGRIERLQQLEFRDIQSRAVGVWTPPGYPDAAPYDTLYMHDGQMLFDGGSSWNRQEWRVDEVAAHLMTAGEVRPFIVVAVANAGPARYAEFFPQRALEFLSASQRERLLGLNRESGEALFAIPPGADAYARFLVEELRPVIERKYAVAKGGEHAYLMGSSMGGLISIYTLSRYPDAFAGAACLSTHWPGLFQLEDNPVPDALLSWLDADLPQAARHRLYFDHGDATLDALYPALQPRVDSIVAAHGYRPQIDWQTRYFPGAEHSEQAWAERLDQPLLFLFGKTTPQDN
jgi:predicted alpha/beta superfamily hydrolase